MADSSEPARWPIREMRTSFDIRHDLLERHGVRVENTNSAVAGLDRHRLSVASPEGLPFSALVGPSLDLLVEHGTPVGLSGAAWHQGGFDLVWDGGRASLQAFGVSTGTRHLSLRIIDREGIPIFDADHMHYDLDARSGRFQAFNMDLRISEALAERLGNPVLAGASVGVLSLEASLVAPASDDDVGTAATNACSDFSGDVDVALSDMSRVDNRLQQDGKVVMTPSAELVNVGTANVPWYSKFSSPQPPYDNDQHPFLVWAFYRLSEGRLEQLAVSDVKHAFLTLNFGCDPGACTDSHILGLGCGDVYGSGTNDSNNSLSYRYEVTAGLGLWESTGSHFDPDNDGNQEHPPQNPDGPFDHRSWVETTELETPGATYYTGSWYLVRDDIDIYNNMGYRLVNPELVGGTWDFDNAGPFTQGPVVDAWIDPSSPPPGTANSKLPWADGHVQLAVATFEDGSTTRFEYLLHNHDFDPQIDTFSVPLNGASVVSTAFRDLDDEVANDWTVSIDVDRVTWSLPGGAPDSPRHTGGTALDWGLAYNFTLEVNGMATAGNGLAEAFEAVVPASRQIPTLVPESDASFIFADDFESGTLKPWSSATP